MSDTLSTDTPRAAVHLGPFVGDIGAEWNGDIDQVVVKVGNAADVSLHLDPASARQLARALIGAADEADDPKAVSNIDQDDDSKVYEGLSPEQADGRACVRCGGDFDAAAPVGRSDTGSQVFACDPGCYVREAGITSALVEGATNLGTES